MYLLKLINRLMNVKNDQYSVTLSLVLNISVLMLIFPVWVFLCTQPPLLPACFVCRPLSAALSSSVQALPALAQVQSLRRVNERLLAENRAMLRVLARLPESVSMPETEDLWSSDSSSSFLSLPSASLHTPLSSRCLHSPLVLCCVPVRQVLHPSVASSH